MRSALLLPLLLCLALTAVAQEPPSAEKKLSELTGAWEKALSDHRKKQQEDAAAQRAEWEKAKKEGRQVTRSMRMMTPFPGKKIIQEHIAAFHDAAETYKGTEYAIPFHLWVVEHGRFAGDKNATGISIEVLMKYHSRSHGLERLARALKETRRLMGREYCDEKLAQLLDSNREPNTRAFALFALNEDALATAMAGTPEYKSARGKLARAISIATKPGLKAVVQAKIDLREKLGEGAEAPDIIGVDMDGTAFKLSDYRGKIIMLDFWGDW